MSYDVAHARLVELATGIVPTYSPTLRFSHAPEGRTGKNLRSRSFSFEAIVEGDGEIAMPFNPDLAGQPRCLTPIVGTFFYRQGEGRERKNLDFWIVGDMRDLLIVFQNDTAWGSRATYNIDHLTRIRFRRTNLDNGDAELAMHFDMQWI